VRLPGLVRPLEDGSAEQRGDLFVEPIPCQHVQLSRELIESAMLYVRPGRALVVGAGACREIPLVSLAQRFEAVVLQDQDADDLAAAVALVAGTPIAAAVTTEVRDLTGITDALIAGAEQRLERASSPAHAAELLIELVDAAELTVEPPRPEWDLVIASCVGTQLHIRALDQITRRYAQRFASEAASLDQVPAWTDAMMRLSWRLQDAFIEHLLGLVEPDGRIYLSDTVQVGMLYQRLAGGWRTPGWYRMTRERFLAELLPVSAQPLHGGQWPYVVAVPSLEAAGLLYNVHAVVMARRDA
jgi:hypothetical protein